MKLKVQGHFSEDPTIPQPTTTTTKTPLLCVLPMLMASRWLKNLSTTASTIYFLLIILQIPLFRVSCRSGMCTTPLELTSSQLIVSEIFPTVVVKALLYPGTVAKSLIKNTIIPSWDNILNSYNFTNSKEATEIPKQHLEVLAGSYLSVAGAFVGLMKPGRMSMFGTILLIWGVLKQGIFGKSVCTDPANAVYIYPTILVALVCAFLCVKYDVKKVLRSSPVRSVVKPFKRSSKSKLK